MSVDQDFPPCSKLFASIGSNFTDTEVREAFEPFGEIQSLYIPKDKTKGGPRGYAFIKYKKTSSAAAAVAAMNNVPLVPNGNRIHVAVSGARKEDNDGNVDIIPNRIIVTMPTFTEIDDIRGIFSEFGTILDITHTKSDKRKAIIKFDTFIEAANCFENCKNVYAPNFLLPRKKEKVDQGGMAAGGGGANYNRRMMGSGGGSSLAPMMNQGMWNQGMAQPSYPVVPANMNMTSYPGGCSGGTKLRVTFNPKLSKEHLFQIFNIVPGFIDIDYLEMTPNGAVAAATYDNGQSASHALERINGLEYPLGSKLELQWFPVGDPNITNLLKTIQEATSALKGSGINVSVNGLPEISQEYGMGLGAGSMGMSASLNMGSGYGNQEDAGVSAATQRRCGVPLPRPQPLDDMSTEVKQRLFFVFRDVNDYPHPEMVTDLFCRFGNLINAHCLKGKRCGYARFSSVEAAERCISTLDGARFCDGALKVEKAEPEKYTREVNKKRKMEVDY